MNKKIEYKARKAYELAYKYEAEWGGCSQCTIRALQEVYDEEKSEVFKALGSFAAGGARECDGICGVYAAGMYFIGTKFGREFKDIGKDPNDPKASKKHTEQLILVKKLHEKFIDAYGTIICHEIHRKLYGRPYYLADKEELNKFYQAGGHKWGCTSVCGNGAKWTVEIIEEGCIY